jgi:hypothetical protein
LSVGLKYCVVSMASLIIVLINGSNTCFSSIYSNTFFKVSIQILFLKVSIGMGLNSICTVQLSQNTEYMAKIP